MDIKLITLASYVKPQIVENKNKNWVLNGPKNSFYQYIIDRNNGSATNSSINSTYISLIYGRGLDFKDGLQGVNDWALLQKYLRPQELRKVIADFQIFNEYSVQVIRTKGGGLSSIKHLPKQLVAPSIKNEDGEIESYWYSEDWTNTNKYRPEEFPAFGTSKDAIEIYVGRPYRVGDEYISSPDYLAGLQYAEMEEEISNLNISSIRNGLSAGYIINIPDGKSWGDEEKDEFERQVKKKLTSSSNASNFIISFNGRDVEIDITPFPVNDNIHKQWDFLTKECKTQLMTAHRVISPSLVGLSSASGFSSVADEMDMSEKQTMKRVIKPKQDFIIDGITDILQQFDINLDLYFKPLTEEIEDIVEEVVEDKKETVKLAGFDPNQKRGADGKWGSGNLNTEKKNCLNKSDLKKKAAKTTAKQVSDYISELNKTKNSDPSRYWSVDSLSKSDAEKSIIIDKPYGAVAVSGEGDIKGLFKKLDSKEKGVGGKLLKDAVSAGGRKLDNFDNYLTKIYLKAGFRVVSRTPFNETYAPDGWVKDLHGTPDVVAMVYDPNKDLDITEKMFSDPSSGYDQMIDYRDKSLVFCGEKDVNLSSQNVDRLISLGEVVGDDWEIIENERCDEITFSEGDLNLIELAQAPKTSNKKSKQDTSLFKVRYQYAGAKKGERDFCNKVIEADKVYREEDLNANYNYNEELSPSGTDSYNIFLFKGGVNCKHWWQRVVYLKKGNDRISVNQARKMILELDPKDRKEASFDKNDKRVAKVAEAQNNYWSLTPNYRDSGVELSAKSKELYQRLAGFDPSQTRGADGKWGSEGCHKKPLKFDELMDQKDQTEKLIEYTTYGSENQYKRTVWIDWFLGENEESKSRIANEIDNDSELERAMKSALYDFWKTESEEGLKSNVSFDDFQDMEINLYRGVSERNKETGTINENGFTSFALTKRLASGFGEVKEFKKKVSDLYGAVNIVGGEIEVLEPQPYSDEFAKKLGIKNSKTYAKELNKDQIKEYFKIIDKKGRNCANFYADNILKSNTKK